MLRLAAHDKDAFESLVRPHLSTLRAAARRLTRNAPDADDLLQDALVRAARSFHLFERGTNMGGWAHRILTNTFINTYRRRVLERSFLDQPHMVADTPGLLPTTLPRLTDGTLPPAALLGTTVTAALGQIPVDFASVVVMADLQDLTYREIAEALNIPVGTVMSRLFRGRRLLQGLLWQHALEQGIVSTPVPAEPRVRKAA